MLSYFLLFLSAFGAATLLPLQSEAVLAALLLKNQQSLFFSFQLLLSEMYSVQCELVVRFKNRTV